MPGEMSGLIPTFDVNGGNNCNGGWGNWGGALIGGAIGGAVGAGWNGNRNGCCNTGCCNNGDQYVMDTLTTMRTDINSIGRDNLMQTAAVQSAICQGFGGVNSSVERVGANNFRSCSGTGKNVRLKRRMGEACVSVHVMTRCAGWRALSSRWTRLCRMGRRPQPTRMTKQARPGARSSKRRSTRRRESAATCARNSVKRRSALWMTPLPLTDESCSGFRRTGPPDGRPLSYDQRGE